MASPHGNRLPVSQSDLVATCPSVMEVHGGVPFHFLAKHRSICVCVHVCVCVCVCVCGACVCVVCMCGLCVWCVYVVCGMRVVCRCVVYVWCTCGVYMWCVHVVCVRVCRCTREDGECEYVVKCGSFAFFCSWCVTAIIGKGYIVHTPYHRKHWNLNLSQMIKLLKANFGLSSYSQLVPKSIFKALLTFSSLQTPKSEK